MVGIKLVCGLTLLPSPLWTSHDFILSGPPLPPTPTGLLLEGEPVGELGEEAKRFGPPCPSLAAGLLLPIRAGQLQLDGHQHPP